MRLYYKKMRQKPLINYTEPSYKFLHEVRT